MRLRMGIVLLSILLVYIPFNKPLYAEEMEPPQLESEAAILVEPETGTVLYEKNATEQRYPASLTKIATAIYAIENGKIDELVTVSENAYRTTGSSVYLEAGEKMSLKQLLKGLLVNSGNDAGIAIAEHLSGDVERFSKDINDYLKKVIGVKNTNFENPHGLYNPNHYTTAEDLAMITLHAMKNQTFREIFGMKELNWDGQKWDTTLYTHHKLLREMPYPGVTGGKTGYIEEAGYTLATTAERKEIGLIAITLNASEQMASYQDTKELLDYGFNNFTQKGQQVVAMNNKEDFRKLANVEELKKQDNKIVSHKKKAEVTPPSNVHEESISHNSLSIKNHDILTVIMLLAFFWITFHYRRSQKL